MCLNVTDLPAAFRIPDPDVAAARVLCARCEERRIRAKRRTPGLTGMPLQDVLLLQSARVQKLDRSVVRTCRDPAPVCAGIHPPDPARFSGLHNVLIRAYATGRVSPERVMFAGVALADVVDRRGRDGNHCAV